MSKMASIIMVTWNRLGYTQKSLESIFQKTLYRPYEVIVVDNHSTDGTCHYLRQLKNQGKIREVIFLRRNYGVGFALNQGMKLARGDYLIRSDNDMVYNRGWLGELVAALDQLPRSLLQVAVFGELVEDGRRAGFRQEIKGVKIKEGPIGGCNMALTRAAYQELGPFPQVMLAEDGIYCSRAQAAGYLIGQIDSATATHIDQPGCSLSERYTKYANYRLEILERQQRAGMDFLLTDDANFYQQKKPLPRLSPGRTPNRARNRRITPSLSKCAHKSGAKNGRNLTPSYRRSDGWRKVRSQSGKRGGENNFRFRGGSGQVFKKTGVD